MMWSWRPFRQRRDRRRRHYLPQDPAVVWGVQTCISTDCRPSDDFEGATE